MVWRADGEGKTVMAFKGMELCTLRVLVTQSCPTLCDPMNCGPPGSSVHGILQARILEWVAISFSAWPHNPPKILYLLGVPPMLY